MLKKRKKNEITMLLITTVIVTLVFASLRFANWISVGWEFIIGPLAVLVFLQYADVVLIALTTVLLKWFSKFTNNKMVE